MKELADKIYHYAKIILWAAERFRDIVYSWPGYSDEVKSDGNRKDAPAPKPAESSAPNPGKQ